MATNSHLLMMVDLSNTAMTFFKKIFLDQMIHGTETPW